MWNDVQEQSSVWNQIILIITENDGMVGFIYRESNQWNYSYR